MLKTEHKAAALVLATVVVLLVTIGVVVSHSFVRSFLRIEQDESHEQLTRVANYLRSVQAELGNTVRDWSYWDATWDFVQDRAPDYRAENLETISTWESLDLDAMLLLDREGRAVYAAIRDAEEIFEGPRPMEPCLGSFASIREPVAADFRTGLCRTEAGPMLVAFAPILKSDGSGPAAGWLAFGRLVDEECFEGLLATTAVRADLISSAWDDSYDVARARPLLAPGRSLVLPVSATRVAAYQLLEDRAGGPPFVLRTAMPRATYRQGRSARTYLVGLVALLGLLFGATASVLLVRLLRAERAGRRMARLYGAFVEHTREGVLLLEGGSLRILNANVGALEVLGRAGAELNGCQLNEILEWREAVVHEMTLRPATLARRVLYRHPDGRPRHLELSWVPMNDHGENLVMVVLRDATERFDLEQQRIRYFAFHDPLTQLPNRLLFRDRLHMALAHAERHDERVALMFIDLDHFKLINDGYGHDVGDQLLIEVARRIRETVRTGDTVSRNGGDEFLVVLPGVQHPSGTIAVADRLVEALRQPFLVDERELLVSASVGLAVYPDDAKDGESLLQLADLAMYEAKGSGRDGWRAFESRMQASVHDLLETRAHLLQAIEGDELELHYQPIARSRDGQLIGLEALVRWRQADGSLVYPGAFIPAAEKTGIIGQLGEWVLRAAARQLRTWHDAGLDPVPVSVNVSALQLARPGLFDLVTGLLGTFQLAPSELGIEVTESVAADEEHSLATLERLHEAGHSISLDDFGTGFSSLAALRRLPLDVVKIDRRFVSDALAGGGQSLLSSIIDLVQGLGLRAVAEGVESAAHCRALANRADALQGYGIGRPAPAHDIVVLLSQRPNLLQPLARALESAA